MPRPKKDGKHVNLYLDRILVEKVESYASQQRVTVTAALEGLLKEALASIPNDSSSSQENTLPDR